MEFKKYIHLEKFGNTEVQNIEIGTCYVFPKIDGTNASVWLDNEGKVAAGSRTRTLTLEKDNAGFYEWVLGNEKLRQFFEEYKNIRLYGEWLVPHSLKTYREEAWQNFYVFDVCIQEEKEDSEIYMHYNDYVPLLEKYGIEYIPPIKIIKNGSYDDFIFQMNKNNNYLIEDGKGMGEGVVLKNYSYINEYGRTCWAKIVSSEFKEKHIKEMGAPIHEKKMLEIEIVNEFVTSALCEKVLAKIKVDNDGQINGQEYPCILNTVFYDLVKEELWEIIKKHNMPTINFKTLKAVTFNKVKENLPQIFQKNTK